LESSNPSVLTRYLHPPHDGKNSKTKTYFYQPNITPESVTLFQDETYMSKLLLILIISFFFISCKDAKFDSIDFIAYSYRKVESSSRDFEKEYKVICPYYLHIDNRYNCQLIKGQTYADSGTYYFESKNDPVLKAIIQEIINKSKQLGKEADFRPPTGNLILYDGSDLKVRIIKDEKSKIIHFWQDQEGCQSFEKLLFYSINLFGNGIETTMDPMTEKRKQEFINFVTKSDSILRPLPPLPPRGLKPLYTPPIVIE
jgi:hypothetical protein